MMNRAVGISAFLLTLMGTGIPCAALVLKAEKNLSATEILAAIDQSSFVDASHLTAEVEMIIRKKGRADKIRTFQVKTQKKGKLVNYLIQFLSPKGIRGSAFMARGNLDGLPDQYLYLPATKMVRKVAGGNALSSFFGSDFSYGDLLPMPDSAKNDIKLNRLSDATVGKELVYRIELVPKMAGSPYGKLILSLSQLSKMPMMIQYFDNEMKAEKTMTIEKTELIGGKRIPNHIRMVSQKKPQSTDLLLKNINPEAKTQDADFTQSAMKRL